MTAATGPTGKASRAETWFRLLVRAYPAGYRATREDETVGVLLEVHDQQGVRASVREAASLVRHGLALRVRQTFVGQDVSPTLGLAGVSLALLLGVLGVQQLAAMGLRGLALDGYPDAWGVHVVWVDPRWPVHALWVVTGLALLLGRHRLAVGSAWVVAGLHCWHIVVTAATGADLFWPGDVGPHWQAPGGAPEASWALLSIAVAVLVGGPARAARACAGLSRRRRRAVVATGLGSVALALAGGPAMHALLGVEHLALTEGVRGTTVPLVLTAGVLARALLRAPHGRGALLLLAALSAAPLGVRWSEPMTLLAAGAAVFAAGYAVAATGRDARAKRPV